MESLANASYLQYLVSSLNKLNASPSSDVKYSAECVYLGGSSANYPFFGIPKSSASHLDNDYKHRA